VSNELTPAAAAAALEELHRELGDYDPETRALVGLRVDDPDEVAVADIELTDEGVLRVGEDIAAVVLVAGDTSELPDAGAATTMRQAFAVLRSGEELGVFRFGDEEHLHTWSTASDEPGVEELRPRSAEANLARRAFGHLSHIDGVHITEFLGRLYLIHLAQLTLERFDVDQQPVTAAALSTVAAQDPFADLLRRDDYPDDELEAARRLAEELTWEHVRALARRGELRIGSTTFRPGHADFLDARGFAQHVDDEILSADELLGALATMGDADLVGWAVERLLERDWYAPSIAIAQGDIAAAAQLASTDPRYDTA